MSVAGQGRPAAPTAKKLAAGTRSDRVNLAEPVPGDGDVLPPEWLDAPALEEWDRLAPDLIEAGVLKHWDVQAFAEWCDAVSTVALASRELSCEGHIIERPVFDRNGKETGTRFVTNEWFYVQRSALDVSAKRAARFGLTPADRSGVVAKRGGSDADEDPTDYLD